MSARSASERLKELYELPVLEKYETDLFQYLPLIADVVEAAEKAGPEPALIVPLRSALTALRNSLEKGTQ